METILDALEVTLLTGSEPARGLHQSVENMKYEAGPLSLVLSVRLWAEELSCLNSSG